MGLFCFDLMDKYAPKPTTNPINTVNATIAQGLEFSPVPKEMLCMIMFNPMKSAMVRIHEITLMFSRMNKHHFFL